MKTKFLLFIFALLMTVLLPSISFAQADANDPNGSANVAPNNPYDAGGPGDIGGAPVPAPIDGGVTLLLAVSVGYGVKTWRDNRKKALSKKQKEGSI